MNMSRLIKFISIIFLGLSFNLSLAYGEKNESLDKAFLFPLQKRDSVLIADQLEYGFYLKKIEEGTKLELLDFSNGLGDSLLVLVRDWKLDTLKVKKQGKGKPALLDIKSSIVLTSFDEGTYDLPSLRVRRILLDGNRDSLLFDALQLEVKTIMVDTAKFKIHDIKEQMKYPITFIEVLPYVLGGLGLILIIFLVIYLVKRFRRNQEDKKNSEPAHIVALRTLEKYRGDKLWVADKQKLFYSGITDALRTYIDSRYKISAMEMTTKEIFDLLKKEELTPELYNEAKELFERADFVKFAKYVAPNEENSLALPVAVRFVTQTYQVDLDNEAEQNVDAISADIEISEVVELSEEKGVVLENENIMEASDSNKE